MSLQRIRDMQRTRTQGRLGRRLGLEGQGVQEPGGGAGAWRLLGVSVRLHAH